MSTDSAYKVVSDDWDALYDDGYDFIESDEQNDGGSGLVNPQIENHINGLHLCDFAVNGWCI